MNSNVGGGRKQMPAEVRARISASKKLYDKRRLEGEAKALGVTVDEFLALRKQKRKEKYNKGGFTQELRKKIAERMVEQWKDPEYRAKHTMRRTGPDAYKHSADTRARISDTLKTRWKDPAQKALWLASYPSGVHLKEETKQLLSLKMKARWSDPDLRRNMTEALQRPEMLARKAETIRKLWRTPQFLANVRRGMAAHYRPPDKGEPKNTTEGATDVTLRPGRRRRTAEQMERNNAARRAKRKRERLAELKRRRNAEIERKKEAALEREKQAELKRERQAALERERLAALECKRQAALERARQAALEREKQAELKRERQAALERERLAALECKRQAALERARQAALERARQAALERERLAQLERERQAALERERQAALERERQAALERERLAALERERQAALEREKQAEQELEQQAQPTQQQRIRKPRAKKSSKVDVPAERRLNLKSELKRVNSQVKRVEAAKVKADDAKEAQQAKRGRKNHDEAITEVPFTPARRRGRPPASPKVEADDVLPEIDEDDDEDDDGPVFEPIKFVATNRFDPYEILGMPRPEPPPEPKKEPEGEYIEEYDENDNVVARYTLQEYQALLEEMKERGEKVEIAEMISKEQAQRARLMDEEEEEEEEGEEDHYQDTEAEHETEGIESDYDYDEND